MAGSLNHIVADNGGFSMEMIENLADAHEALEECFRIIYHLSGGDINRVNEACRLANAPHVEHRMALDIDGEWSDE